MGKSELNADKSTKIVSKRDLFFAWFKWQWFIESCPSWERLQASGFLFSISHVLDKLYVNMDEKISAFKRHLVFFNCQGNWGSMIGGIILAMEEEKANGAEIPGEAINGLKTGLMGPIAGIGDTLDWGTLVPISVSLGLPFAMNGNWIGSVIPFILISSVMLTESYVFFYKGYKYGKKAVSNILQSGAINKLILGAGIIGMFVLGSLAANYVALSTPIAIPISGGETMSLQADILDNILEGILPLGLVVFCWQMLLRKKSVSKIMVYLLIIGLVGGVLNIF